MPEPQISDTTTSFWQVVNPETGGIAFTSEHRDDAEKWLWRLSAREPRVLTRVERRSRCETWWGEPEVVPWHAPCDWIAAQYEDGSTSPVTCMRHDHHGKDEPVPDEFWLGRETAPKSSESTATDGRYEAGADRG